MTDSNSNRRQLIIGSGAAGLTAAIYSARAALEPLVFEGSLPGGQLTTTTEVENFPGFEHGILGPQLMQTMHAQAARFGTEFLPEEVERVDFSGRELRVFAGGQEFRAASVIIATGARPRWLGLENERRFVGRGVSTCATCDAFFYRGKEVAVIGGGDSAMEEADFISKFATRVTLIHRRDTFRASQIMQQRTLSNPKLKVLWNTVVQDVIGSEEHGVEALRLTNLRSGDHTELKVDGMFLAIGHEPNSKIFQGRLELDQEGYIIVRGGTAASVPGVFAAGDVVDYRYRQAITAAGMGCMASLEAEKYLAGMGRG